MNNIQRQLQKAKETLEKGNEVGVDMNELYDAFAGLVEFLEEAVNGSTQAIWVPSDRPDFVMWATTIVPKPQLDFFSGEYKDVYILPGNSIKSKK